MPSMSLLSLVLGLATASLATSAANNASVDSNYNASAFPASQILNSPYPYDFPVPISGDQAEGSPFPMEDCSGIKLEEATIDELQQYMNNGQLSSVELLNCYLRRIQQTDFFIKYVRKPFHGHTSAIQELF